MADLLQVDVVQQLEVALIGSPTTQVIDLLSGGLMQSTASTSVAMTSTSVTPVQPHPGVTLLLLLHLLPHQCLYWEFLAQHLQLC